MPETPAPAAPAPRQYEFSSQENVLVSALARSLRFVGFASIAVAILLAVGAVAPLLLPRQPARELVERVASHTIHGDPRLAVLASAVALVIELVVLAASGIWMRRASAGFDRIVATQGADIGHLMDALVDLRRSFARQRTLLFVAVPLFVAALLVRFYVYGF